MKMVDLFTLNIMKHCIPLLFIKLSISLLLLYNCYLLVKESLLLFIHQLLTCHVIHCLILIYVFVDLIIFVLIGVVKKISLCVCVLKSIF